MTTSADRAAISSMGPLCRPLHDAISAGAEFARETRGRGKLLHPDLDFLGAHITRTFAHERLLLEEDLGSWRPNKRQPNNGGLQLFSNGATIRVLRAGLNGQIPHPGRNRARRAFYCQPTITGMATDAMIPQLAISNFIATWEVLDWDTYEVGIQVARPVGTFRFGGKARVDLSFWLPTGADELAGLEFQGDDSAIELDIPGEENDGGFGLGG